MCSIGLAFTAIGGIVSFIGSQNQAAATQEAANRNAELQRRNALEASRTAAIIRKQGAKKDTAIAIRGRLLKGLQIAGGAGRGVRLGQDVADGDTLALSLIDTDERTRQNVTENRFDVIMRARGMDVQAGALDAQAGQTEFQGAIDAAGQRSAGIGSLLTTGAKVGTGAVALSTATTPNVVSSKWDDFGTPTDDNTLRWDL